MLYVLCIMQRSVLRPLRIGLYKKRPGELDDEHITANPVNITLRVSQARDGLRVITRV